MTKTLKYSILGLAFVAVAGFSAWTIKTHTNQSSETIILGSQGTDTTVWQHIASSQEAKDAHLKIKVKDFTDSAALNRALADGAISANAFQSYAYYVTYNKANTSNKVYALGTSYIQPMGLYSGKYQSVSKLPKNATIAIANDPAAESRGLKLLESAGLIKLKTHAVDDLVVPTDITENKKNVTIKTVVSTSTPSLLHDNGIDAVAIDNNTAQQAKLDVFKDAIFHEKLDQNTRANVNVIVTNKTHKNDAKYQKLVNLYHNKKIQKWIKQNYPGKIAVNKTISELEK